MVRVMTLWTNDVTGQEAGPLTSGKGKNQELEMEGLPRCGCPQDHYIAS